MTRKDSSEYAASETSKLRVRRAATVTLKGLSIEETIRDRIGPPASAQRRSAQPGAKPVEQRTMNPARKNPPSTTDLRKLSADILAKRGKPVR